MTDFILFDKVWKKYKMDDIFIFHKGKRLVKEDMNPGNTNFIASIDDNNGIRQKIDLPQEHKGNCITVNYNGSVGEAFYQDKPFRASDDVNVLYPKGWNLNRSIGLFLSTVIRFNKYRFGYGRKWTLDKMKETTIALPSSKQEMPDWGFMCKYVDSFTDLSKITTKIKRRNLPLDMKKWKRFKLRDIFDFKRGKGITKEEIDSNPGKIPCIQGGEFDNGILGYMNSSFIKEKNHVYITAPFLSLARVGSSGSVNIQGKNSYIGDKAISLKIKKDNNIYVYTFLSTILNANKYKYFYGRGVVIENYINGHVLLPVDKSGNPDWRFMESYIKSLPYSDKI